MESFFKEKGPNIATTRAGNVIGGGVWALDRIVPVCVRAWSKGGEVEIRNPNATRPWQHVLEPLSGYLILGKKLLEGNHEVRNESFNFGPPAKFTQSVGDLITNMAKHWPGAEWKFEQEIDSSKPESTLLKLNCDKAFQLLSWNSILDFQETIRMTGEWYQVFYGQETSSISETTSRQIIEYTEIATQSNLAWTE